MDIYDFMDPELAAAHRQMPRLPLNLNAASLGALRATLPSFAELSRVGPDVPVRIESCVIGGVADHPQLTVRIYRPTQFDGPLGGLLWIHGGGYVVGSCDMSDSQQAAMAIEGRCVVVSVEYRLAPEHPFPAPLDDCYAALQWLYANAAELGVDPARLAIGGASAGGGLAAGLALRARDRGEIPLVFQLLVYPMLDDRNVTPSSHFVTFDTVWNRANNEFGWRSYLGAAHDTAEISAHAAPARATDLRGLPPAFIPVGTLDLFLDENIDYAQRLARAAVPTELHVYPGAFHGSEGMIPQASLSQRMWRDICDALRRGLAG